MTDITGREKGLTSAAAAAALERYGPNVLAREKKQSFILKALRIVCEPMFLLLIAAASIYFLLGEVRDGAIMLIFVVGIIAVDVIQEWKTDRTLSALRDLTSPRACVVRDGSETLLDSSLIVPGDVVLVAEGDRVPADGALLSANDLCVDESSLTGESEGVWKSVWSGAPDGDHWRRDCCYSSTVVTQGSARILVTATGADTEYGRIGASVASAPEMKTPLQKQTGSLVRLSAGIAAVLFALVSGVTYINLSALDGADRLVASVLSGISLAMAMIPEEFPVILTVFLSMGAWRMARHNALVRRLPAVETLGAVSVLCVDKTGTITQNRMSVRQVWEYQGGLEHLVELMGLGCESETYDPMERAMLDYCEGQGITRDHLFGGRLITEYPFTNENKMMGHVWEHDGGLVIAAKGSAERIMSISLLDDAQRSEVMHKVEEMSAQGLRVIAVGETHLDNERQIPSDIHSCRLDLCGLVGLADPPREGMTENIALTRRAGVRVVMITGDNGITAAAVAESIGMEQTGAPITGEMLDAMSDEELRRAVGTTNIFSRVLPSHKMRIVSAFRDNGHIVAMTGDGVNDAPALKHADIGVAMGGRGSAVAREAADLILTDDNFSTIINAISDGRRIYDNIRRAVGYVFTIHIPIALACLIAPMLGIASESLMLLPLHVVLLELLIDPTCSIVLERQPAERDVMSCPPRPSDAKLVTASSLGMSLLQGLFVFAGAFGAYLFELYGTGDAAVARSMGLAVIFLSNLLLVAVTGSSRDTAVACAWRLRRDPVMWAVVFFTLACIVLMLYTPLAGALSLAPLSAGRALTCVGLSAVCVLWYEAVKAARRARERRRG